MSGYILDKRKIYLCILLLLVAVVIDTTFIKIYNITYKNLLQISEKKLIHFTNTLFLFGIELYILLMFRKQLHQDQNIKLIRIAFRLSIILFGAVVIVFLALFYQIFFHNYYEKIYPIIISGLSYGTSCILLIMLASQFFYWFRTNKNLRIFLYFLSISIICFDLVIASLYTSIVVNDQSNRIREYIGGSIFFSNEKHFVIKNLYVVSSILSFTFIWLTSALFMKNYQPNFTNSIKYWSILCIPLVYFFFNYFYDLVVEIFFKEQLISNPISMAIFLTLFLSLSKPIGGVTFGLLFWRLSSYLKYERNLQTYMIISGIGIMLLFTTNQISLQTISPFPPFGLSTVTVLIIAGFLLLIGIYNSASLVSLNTNLRKIIYQYALDSKLIGLIGNAQLEGELEKTVEKIVEDKRILKLEKEYPFDLDEGQIKDQLDYILKELKKENKELN